MYVRGYFGISLAFLFCSWSRGCQRQNVGSMRIKDQTLEKARTLLSLTHGSSLGVEMYDACFAQMHRSLNHGSSPGREDHNHTPWHETNT